MGEIDEILKGEDSELDDIQEETPIIEDDDIEATGEDSEPPAEEVESKVSIESLQAELEKERKRIAETERRAAAFQRAAEDERQKRQSMQEKPNFWDDPDKVIQDLSKETDRKIEKTRIDMSENFAKMQYTDYDEKLQVFAELAQENPALADRMRASENPAKFAYDEATKVVKMREFGDIEAFEAKIRADERAKLRTELSGKVSEEVKRRTSLPGTLTNVRASTNQSSAVSGDDSPGSILGR